MVRIVGLLLVFKEKKMFKLGDYLEDDETYAKAAEWCNQGQQYTIENRTIVEIVVTDEQKISNLRLLRNTYLELTDKYMLSDYPIEDEERENYRQYRQYLRDLPEKENFPDIAVKTFNEWKGA